MTAIPTWLMLVAAFVLFIAGLLAWLGDWMRQDYHMDGPVLVGIGLLLMSLCVAALLR